MTNYLKFGDKILPVDKEGYLENLADWSKEVAESLSLNEGLELNEAHWELIYLLRRFHQESGLSPAMRVFVKLVKKEFGEDKGNSLYLLKLFPQSPAKLASKIAGLPRPTNCL